MFTQIHNFSMLTFVIKSQAGPLPQPASWAKLQSPSPSVWLWLLICRFLCWGRGCWVSCWEAKWSPFTSQMPQGDRHLGTRYPHPRPTRAGARPSRGRGGGVLSPRAQWVGHSGCLLSLHRWIETRKLYAMLDINTTGYKLQEAKVHHLSRSVLYLEQLILCQAYALLLPFVLGFCLSVFCFLFLSIVFSACYH